MVPFVSGGLLILVSASSIWKIYAPPSSTDLSSLDEFNPCLRVRLPISLVTDPSLIVRQYGEDNDIRIMTVDESDDDDGECPICFAQILQADIFQARQFTHYYHVNCIDERQRRCLLTMDGITSCVKCKAEINNLV